MGILDRIRSVFGSDGERSAGAGDREDRTAGGQPGIDRGAGTTRVGVDRDDDRKTGAHGSHWDTVVESNDAIRELTVAAIEDGESTPGRSVEAGSVEGFGYPASGRVRARVLAADGTVTTAYPVADGTPHEVRVEEVIDWANDVEAQLALELDGERFGAFDAGYFRRGADYETAGAVSFAVAGLAYELGPAGAEDVLAELDVDAEDVSEGVEAFFGFPGGDVDDYVVRGEVRATGTHDFLGRTIHRLEVPFLGGEGRTLPVYAGDHVLGGYEPTAGDEIEGVVWLQGRV